MLDIIAVSVSTDDDDSDDDRRHRVSEEKKDEKKKKKNSQLLQSQKLDTTYAKATIRTWVTIDEKRSRFAVDDDDDDNDDAAAALEKIE